MEPHYFLMAFELEVLIVTLCLSKPLNYKSVEEPKRDPCYVLTVEEKTCFRDCITVFKPFLLAIAQLWPDLARFEQ